MNFTIRKNSTLPALKFDITPLVAADISLADKLKSSVVTFSMVNTENGTFAIANKTGKVSVETPSIHNVSCPTNKAYYVQYKWAKKDTSKVGNYLGEFKITFLEGNESIVVPVEDKITISIVDSITTSTSGNTPKPTPSPTPVPTQPNVAGGSISMTYEEIKNLKKLNLLKQGSYYIITDYRSIHRLAPSGSCANVLGVVEPLMVLATETNKFDQIAKSLIHEQDIIHYNFDMVEPDCVLCDESKGVITYREDTVKRLSAYFDWRVDKSINCGIDVNQTFGSNCKNISIGSGSRYIYIGADSSDIEIGKSCFNIKLPKMSTSIKLGNRVSDHDFSGFAPDYYVNRNLTINDNSRGGDIFIEIDLFTQQISEVETYDIAMIPKGMMVKDYSISASNVSGLTGGSRISFGLRSIGVDEIMPDVYINELNNTYMYNTVFTQAPDNEDSLIMAIKGAGFTEPIEGSKINLNLNFIKV
jgi:hypothetical protein